MKRIYQFLLGGAMAGGLFVSCFDARDFDFDKLNYDNLHPQFHLPLLSDTLYITDAIDGDSFQFDDNGQGYFTFDVGDIEMPKVTEIFTLPGQQLGLDMPISLPNTGNTGISIPIPAFEKNGEESVPLTFGDREDVKLDSVTFAGGTIRLTNKYSFAGGGTLTVTVPGLKNSASQSFSRSIIVTGTAPQTIPLSGYTLTPDNNGKLAIQWHYRTNGFTLSSSMTQINLGFDLSLSDIAIREARGYFGKHTEYARQTIDIGDFDEIGGSWALKEAAIALEIQNSIRLPLRVVIDTIRSYTNTAPGARPAAEKVRIDSLNLKETGLTRDTLTIPGEVISVLPKKMDVVIKVQSNPEGNPKEKPAENVISNTDHASATAKVLVPLKIKDVNIALTDTVDLDVSDLSFDNLGLLLNVRNSLPLGVKLQCTLLQKGASLGELFDTPVEIPAGNVTTDGNGESKVTAPSETHKFIETKKGMAEKLKNADKIAVSFTAFTGNTGNTYVRITKDDYVSLKIGLSAGINVGDLKEKL
ncbi:MAG: hypothetical protein LBG31_00900 [Prevotellaceae bacterium]|jgi:hypothetical protein|nr:hypothetical protein [Prevotellaceae bacterium]